MEYYMNNAADMIDPVGYLLRSSNLSQYIELFRNEDIDIIAFTLLESPDLIVLNVDNNDIATILNMVNLLRG